MYSYICIKICITLHELESIRKITNKKKVKRSRQILYQTILLYMIELKSISDKDVQYNLFRKCLDGLILRLNMLAYQECTTLNL